jgi:putative ABC transport system permease protein
VSRPRISKPTRLRPPDAIAEAFTVIAGRPARAILASLGTLLAVAWFVAVPGLVSTANAQVANAFTQRLSTQVLVRPVRAAATPAAFPFPPDVDGRLAALHGVVAAGVFWPVKLAVPVVVSARPGGPGQPAPPPGAPGQAVIAASRGFLSAAGVTVTQGRSFSPWAVAHSAPVCLLGADAARALRITGLAGQPDVFGNNEPCAVIGIFRHAIRRPALLRSVLIPTSTASVLWGPADQRAGAVPSVLIRTRPGAVPEVARQAPDAINPDLPGRYRVFYRVTPQRLRDQVTATLSELLAVVGWASLGIGVASIANATWLSVLDRGPEYALRRALGARRRHVAFHVIWESAILGLLGGLAGASLGLAIVILVGHARHWMPVLASWPVLASPAAGAAAGVLAGLVPAIRAARIAPALAMNTSAAA